MDLIYANALGEEQGVLDSYKFDLAYGSDENNFAITIALDQHCMNKGYYVYIDGTEYGGVVDSIEVDTNLSTVTYMGRTWHGILAGSVICPKAGYDYYTVSGDSNAILTELIRYLELEDIFEVSQAESDIEIAQYQFSRYVDAYSGICSMLQAYDGKLIFKHQNGKVLLSAVFLIDYSVNEEWDSSQLEFRVARNYRPVNHLICLGQGDLKDRAVLHLFTDENGGIQKYYSNTCPYVIDDNGEKTYMPVQNTDYVLDKSAQLMKGIDEVAEVYDSPSAEIVENYVLTTTQPSKWSTTYSNYYIKDSEGYFVNASAAEVESATKLTSQPADWSTSYANYYSLINGQYEAVEGLQNTVRTRITNQPNDWTKNYADYVYFYTDGVSEEYRNVEGITKYKYIVQTQKPTDWDEKATSEYYQKKKNGGYEKVTLTSKKKVPTWKAKKYYTRESYKVAPAFSSSRRYYIEKEVTSAPIFSARDRYTVQTKVVKPSWARNTFYRMTTDSIASLLEAGLERLKEIWNCDDIAISLEPDQEYDLGDIVGANENVTGITVWQPVTKKIVTIEEEIISISYEIGGNT